MTSVAKGQEPMGAGAPSRVQAKPEERGSEEGTVKYRSDSLEGGHQVASRVMRSVGAPAGGGCLLTRQRRHSLPGEAVEPSGPWGTPNWISLGESGMSARLHLFVAVTDRGVLDGRSTRSVRRRSFLGITKVRATCLSPWRTN